MNLIFQLTFLSAPPKAQFLSGLGSQSLSQTDGGDILDLIILQVSSYSLEVNSSHLSLLNKYPISK